MRAPGVALLAVAVACGPAVVDAPCTGDTCPCDAGLFRCGAECVDLRTDGTNCGACGTVCNGGATCTQGACSCAPGAVLCSGQCTDRSSDPQDCGVCGRVCAPG